MGAGQDGGCAVNTSTGYMTLCLSPQILTLKDQTNGPKNNNIFPQGEAPVSDSQHLVGQMGRSSWRSCGVKVFPDRGGGAAWPGGHLWNHRGQGVRDRAQVPTAGPEECRVPHILDPNFQSQKMAPRGQRPSVKTSSGLAIVNGVCSLHCTSCRGLHEWCCSILTEAPGARCPYTIFQKSKLRLPTVW